MTAHRTKDVFETGRQQLAEGDNASAIVSFSKALNVDPLRSEAYRFRAIAKAALRDRLGSESDFANAIETTTLDEAAAAIHVDRGAARLERGETLHARADFERAVQIDAKTPRAQELMDLLDGDDEAGEADENTGT